MEGDDPREMQVVGGDALFRQLLDALLDDTLSGAPTDQGDLGIRVAHDSRGREFRQQAVHLALALLDHRAALVRVGELVAD